MKKDTRSRGSLSTAALAHDLNRADDAPDGKNINNPILMSAPSKYCRATVNNQGSIVFACVARAQDAYKSRFDTEKENSCPPPNNIPGSTMKHKKGLATTPVAVFVNSTSSCIAPLAKKFVAAKTTSKKLAPLSKTSLFAVSGTSGCKCTGCEEPKAGVIYNLDCYQCEGSFKSRPHCLSTYFTDVVSCHELCGTNICPKCHFKNLVGENQCTGCGQHTCNLCIQKQDYMTCSECDIAIYNNNLKDCAVDCEKCEHQYCEYCWLHSVGHRCECGSYRRCTSCIGEECKSCGFGGTYGTPDSKNNVIDLCSDEKSDDGDKHPW
jgi:hypothetical protein